jgi:ligand-binding sensor domain-containing protein
MSRVLLLTLFVLSCLPYSGLPQEYSYTHYDVKDGLAGSTVYCMAQDKAGFLWMGTEAGLSRFDGTHFTNFTLEDGLPDIEVLQIFADSRGRIWMAPFSVSICYYADGKIHNQENDTLLKKIHLREKIHSIAEDAQGNILLAEKNVLHLCTPSGHVIEIHTINGQPLICGSISKGADGNFLVDCRGEVYHFSYGKFTPYFSHPSGAVDGKSINNPLFVAFNKGIIVWKNAAISFRVRSLHTDKFIDIYTGLSERHVSYSVIGDSLAYDNGADGTTECNIATGAIREYRLGARVSKVFRDDEGNTWFTTLGHGIFRLNSDEVKNIDLFLPSAKRRCVVHSIQKVDSDLVVGTDYNALFRFSLPSMKLEHTFRLDSNTIDELNFVHRNKDGSLLLGTGNRILVGSLGGRFTSGQGLSVKKAILKNDSEIIVAGAYGVELVDANTLRVKDTLFRERATTVGYINGELFVGTLKGLYVLRKGQTVEYPEDSKPHLRKRISAIQSSASGFIWIATYGDGIIVCKDGRQVGLINKKQGLSSDICRALALDGNTLWVGTDKGLNKVEIGNPVMPVTTYTSNDGLASDIINTIFVDSSIVYVGTPSGLSYFNAGRVDRTAGCRLSLLGITNSGKDRLPDTSSLQLAYSKSNIRFEFAGISYKSSGNIWYSYRLLGLDTSWKRTRESFLEYPTLPSGDYELQLQATNRFGVDSRPLSIRFTVATPFWKTVWFNATVLLLFLFATWLFVTLRIKQIRQRQARQNELTRRMTETEHMALQAQMNPHFIFNCLNSIQQYIFDQDTFNANKYITGFAKLIRATLHNSSKTFISLSEEVSYLSTYLSLEKIRFKDKMDYRIEVDQALQGQLEAIQIPPMLIQPYVENSLRHGLRHRSGNGGSILIKVLQEGDKIAFVIEDNGIGRERAARYKTREHIEYQSKGMSLTADRIRLINSVNQESIGVEVVDLKNGQNEAGGTRVIIRFPRFDLFL